MHSHAERGHDQPQPPLAKSKNASALTGPFPAKAGPTKKHRVHLRDRGRTPVGPASAGKLLICFKAFDFPTQKVLTPQNATWVQAERRFRAVG
jgi:hypothetical protein